MKFRRIIVAIAAAMGLAPGVHARTGTDATITSVEETGGSGRAVVEVLLTNEGAQSRALLVPDHIGAIVHGDNDAAVTLDRAPEVAAMQTIAPGGFVRVRYSFMLPHPHDASTTLVSIPDWNTPKVALAHPESQSGTQLADNHDTPPAAPPASTGRDGSVQSRLEVEQNEFLGSFSPYEASYIAFGTAKDSEWRVQLSFKYRILGSGKATGHRSWSDGLYFGFTNRLYWDIASDASFRDVNYAPELFYRTPEIALSNGMGAGLQFGLQHESNGRSGKVEGRSVNNVYVSPTFALDLGNGYRLSAAPRVSVLVGGKAGNPDILTYRGATSLGLRLGKDDGLMLATSSRYNFGSGKGAVSGELSYPLTRILRGGPQSYLFVQAFTGYGESLRDYDRQMSRLRAGFAITR